MNFGDPDLAPRVVWNVKPYEDDGVAVTTFMRFAEALQFLRLAGKLVADPSKLAKDFGLDLGELLDAVPLAPVTADADGKIIGKDAVPGGGSGGDRDQHGAEARAIRFDPQLHARVERQRIRIAETSADLAEALAFAEAETDAIRAKMRPRTR